MKLTDIIQQAKPINLKYYNQAMILAPHPDDESLGCGGLIATLTQQGKKVYVVFITDGTMSHPNSKKYPAQKLAALRKEEAIAALKELNVPSTGIFFINKIDRAFSTGNDEGFEKNADSLQKIIKTCKPELILVPYEKDPHPDHRYTWQMLMYIRKQHKTTFSILEYIIWLYNLGEEKDLPQYNAEWLYADITHQLKQKQKAIAKHISQTTRLIDDDPEGFMLTPDVLQYFNTNKEYFLNRNL